MKQGIKLAVFPLLACLLMITSCEDNTGDSGSVSTVNITFRALFDGQPLVMNERYMYNGKELAISKLNFFLSDLVLVKGTLEVNLKEIDLVDFSDVNLSTATATTGISLRKEGVPIDTYDGIKFGIGVPSDLNAQTPADFSPNHPLSEGYWSNWNSYIFQKIEGRYDDDNDPADLEESFVYHIGFDEFYRERVFSNLELQVTEDNTTEILIELELLDLLKDGDGTPFNFTEIGNIHSEESQNYYTNIIANNWVNAFSL